MHCFWMTPRAGNWLALNREKLSQVPLYVINEAFPFSVSLSNDVPGGPGHKGLMVWIKNICYAYDGFQSIKCYFIN